MIHLYSILQKLTNIPSGLEIEWRGDLHIKMREFYNLPNELTYREKMLFLNDSLKVAFVRHPFVRLVSTYRDKLIDHNYRHWRKEMVKKPSNSKVDIPYAYMLIWH